jgi:hypothetical protein
MGNINLKNQETTQATDPASKGQRLTQARLMAGLSRTDIEAKYGSVKASSLKSWENGRYSGLTPQGARSISLLLKQEGIQCTVGWLLAGEGSPPTVIQKVPGNSKTKATGQKDSALTKEIEVFLQNHPNAICIQISDDGMEPHYQKGDYVAGERFYQDTMQIALSYPCIVETQMGQIFIRLVRAGSKEGLYTLQCSNLSTQLQKPTLYDVELSSVAPIIWHRRTSLR